jgi:hypothetical protein
LVSGEGNPLWRKEMKEEMFDEDEQEQVSEMATKPTWSRETLDMWRAGTKICWHCDKPILDENYVLHDSHGGKNSEGLVVNTGLDYYFHTECRKVWPPV